MKGRNPLGDVGIVWRIGLKMIRKEIGCEDVFWIPVPQDRNQWWAFVNTVMHFRVA
jgi:hypothetical protein